MKTRHSISIRFAGALLGLPLAIGPGPGAQAADEARPETPIRYSFDLGAHVLDGDSWRFGKYTGLTEDGVEGALDFHVESRPAWDSGDTRSWSIQGWRLGLDSARLKAEYVDQGAWRVGLDYREIPNYRFDDGHTPFSGAGTTLLELPAGWVAPLGGDTGTLAKLGDSLAPVGIYSKRERLDLRYDHKFDRSWVIDVTWRHENKDGNGLFGGTFGTQGLNPRSALLPAPIDWQTDIMEARLDFGNSRYQFGVAFYASWFENGQDAVTWHNPFGARSSWEPAAGYPNGYGLYSLDPDNEAMQFRLYGGLNLSPTSRLSADFTFGSMEQDDPLFDYSVNPDLQVHTPLPAASANAKIDNTHAAVRYTARPLPGLGLVANYTLDKRDNKTPRATWVYIGNDSENQKPDGEGRINLPYSYEKQQWDLIATWRANPGLRFSGGVEWTDTSRSYAEVLDSDEGRLFAGLSVTRWSKASLSLDYSTSDRNVDDYVGNRPYLLYRVPGSVADDDFDNLPALRKYNQTDRRRDEFRLRADFFPVDAFNFAVSGSHFDDDYDDPDGLFGLQSSRVRSWSFDAGWYPNETISLTGYYTVEAYDALQAGRMWSNKVAAGNPANDWFADVDDDVQTWNLALVIDGLGKDSGAGDRLRVGFDYTCSQVESDIAVTGVDKVITGPLPTLRTEMNAWSVYGSYAVNEHVGVRLSYQQQDLASDDFALDDVPIGGSPSVILFGQAAANYDVSLLMLSLSYRY